MADKGDLALAAAKLALKTGAGSSDDDDDGDPPASWPKKIMAGGVGLLAAFYLVNQLIPIVPILNQLHYLMALGIIYWSMSVWGVRPLKVLKSRREQKKLEAADAEKSASGLKV